MNNDSSSLSILRHDAAHVLAMAVQELFPGTQVAIGPVIEDGFYYDFLREEPFTSDDLILIEKKMKEIVDRDLPTKKEIWDREFAIKHFEKKGETLKAKIISEIPEGEEISIYKHGEWLDLCRGPHLASTGQVGKYFKLMKVSGAYWRGDSKNQQLQRIYGTCWKTNKELKGYLKKIEEAEKRDHRKLGRQMNLFHFQEESPGSVFWHPRGWTFLRCLVEYMRMRQDIAGYQEINTPDILDKSLWESSGHWEKFGENMFITQTPDNRDFALKPMNCPGCIQIYNQGVRSYRELPLMYSEFGKVHRYEPSGALHGLLRVRSFTQDDAHIFCTEEQIMEESLKVTNLILDIYKKFGFEDVLLTFSDRPKNRVGTDVTWDKAEKALLESIKATKLKYSVNKGEGAFYGPKIEFVLRDAIGRDWQCGTLQVDLNLPSRLKAFYIDRNGKKCHPVMLHRALFGSLERFAGILIEHYTGKLPLWLSPVQVVISPLTEQNIDYSMEVYKSMKKSGIRAEIDLRNEKINYKIREHSLYKIPVMLVCGKREMENKTVTVRYLGSQELENYPIEEAIRILSIKCQMPT